MSRCEPIPLTIVSGGAELPSVHRQLLDLAHDAASIAPAHLDMDVPRAPDRHVAVTVDVGERSPGCPCCRLRLDVIDAVSTLVRRRRPPAQIVVAVPDLPHDPTASSVTTVAHTVLSDPDLRRWVRLDAVVATIDAVHTATRLRTGSTVLGDVTTERLAIADRVVITRADRVIDSSLHDVRRLLGGLNRIGRVLAPAVEHVTARQLLAVDGWHGAPAVRSTPTVADVSGRVEAAPEVVVIEQSGVLDPDGVDAWLDDVLTQHAPRLVRLQGALAVAGSTSRVCCHGVGSYAMSHPEHEHGRGRRSDRSVVVAIGHGLPADRMTADLRATAVRG